MRPLLSLLLAAISFGSCKAQTKTPASATDNKSLLWKITKPGSRPSYLFGTMHLLCQNDYVWTDVMKNALAESEEVTFEMDMDDPAVLMAAMAGMQQTGGKEEQKTLDKSYSPAEWKRLRSFLKDTLDIDAESVKDMSAIELSMSLITKMMDCSIPVSYEANILLAAKAEKKEIRGLESAQEQLDVLKGLPQDSVAESLLDMVDSFQTSKAAYRRMVEYYKTQNLPALDVLMRNTSSLGLNESSTGPLLDDRNAKWIARIGEQMAGKSTFFAVGAGHLWGDKGVIALLRKEGYTVQAVR